MRLYTLITELRTEAKQNMTELQDEVRGYRADLNGRLRTLETAEAHRSGHDHGRGQVGRTIIAVAAIAASIGSVVGVVAVLL